MSVQGHLHKREHGDDWEGDWELCSQDHVNLHTGQRTHSFHTELLQKFGVQPVREGNLYLSDEGVADRRALPAAAQDILHVSCRWEKPSRSDQGVDSAQMQSGSLTTCVGCRHSSGQSGDCGGAPGGGEAGSCPRSCLAPIARRAWEGARNGGVGWRRRLGLLGAVVILGVVQCVLVRRRVVRFRGHALVRPPGWKT